MTSKGHTNYITECSQNIISKYIKSMCVWVCVRVSSKATLPSLFSPPNSIEAQDSSSDLRTVGTFTNETATVDGRTLSWKHAKARLAILSLHETGVVGRKTDRRRFCMIHHHTTHRLLENHLWLTGANHLTERERDAFSRLSLGLQKKMAVDLID